MPSWQARAASFIVRRRVKPALGDFRDIGRVRRVFGQAMPAPRGVRYTQAAVGGVSGEWVQAEGQPSHTLLYLHGGGFVGCSPRTHRAITASLALRGARVFVPDYRLAPEHPFPAAVEDACAAWRALCAEAKPGDRLTVAGDSAGGNLALALMLSMRDSDHRLPDAAVLFSPSTDLTGASPSLQANAERDAMFRGDQLGNLATAYLAGADPAQPFASPLLGDLHGLPPLMLHASEDEALRDDSVRLADKARAAGVQVALQLWSGVPHVWQLLHRLPEAKQSLDAAGRFLREASSESEEHVEVVIMGAGLSGIGAAAHLQQRCPGKRYAILESREAIGGTWDLFRYPGIRSDSDMHTLGYAFKPWTGAKALADGPSIRDYIRQTAAERGIDRHIRFGHRVLKAEWSSADSRWHLTVRHGDAQRRLSCDFFWGCSGYYRYDEAHRPGFEGEDAFEGTLVHAQFWPQSLDWRGKRVVVVGSGATAVTLVPELAKQAAHVTMLQRSPTYILSLPAQDAIAVHLQRLLPSAIAYRLVRAKNIAAAMLLFKLSRRWPRAIGRFLVKQAHKQAGPGVHEADLTPRYGPWDQRMCFIPDGDLFNAVREGRASVATDEIERFTPRGLQLRSGRELQADVVVLATGLKLNVLGDVAVSVDGEPVRFAQRLAYKGVMFSGVPNLVSTFGYANASWTLRADLIARFTCRLLRFMQRHGHAAATPHAEPGVNARPFLDLSSGYVQRASELLPKQGDRRPWRVHQNYLLDLLALRFGRLDDGTLQFGAPAAGAAQHRVAEAS